MLWPSDVAIDVATRRIFVADTGNARLSVYGFRFDPDEAHAFDPERVHFIEQLDLESVSWARDGEIRLHIEPRGLWRDGQGGLCIADPRNRAVWRLDAQLVNGTRFGCPAEHLEPIDGCAGPLVGESGQPKIREQYVVDRLGGSIFGLHSGKTIAGGLQRPSAALLTQSGELYISDEGANALLRWGNPPVDIARGSSDSRFPISTSYAAASRRRSPRTKRPTRSRASPSHAVR
jgi:hypothetical protein